jgi:hypothetical protein
MRCSNITWAPLVASLPSKSGPVSSHRSKYSSGKVRNGARTRIPIYRFIYGAELRQVRTSERGEARVNVTRTNCRALHEKPEVFGSSCVRPWRLRNIGSNLWCFGREQAEVVPQRDLKMLSWPIQQLLADTGTNVTAEAPPNER